MKKIVSTREKGLLELAFIRLEKFKAEFAQTSLFADLNTQFPEMEIFEMNDGKFEISTVQQAFEDWTQQKTVNRKRADYSKDLDKLISGDYVLMPKEPTARMMDAGSAAKFEYDTVGDIYQAMIKAAQGVSL